MAAGRVLPRHQSQPGGELTSVIELLGIGDTGHQCRGRFGTTTRCATSRIASGQTTGSDVMARCGKKRETPLRETKIPAIAVMQHWFSRFGRA